LEAGSYDQKSEGSEELMAWREWDTERAIFGRRNMSFLRGAAIWIAPPITLRERLLSLSPKAGDKSAADILAGWAGADAKAMEATYPPSVTDEALEVAAAALQAGWAGNTQTPPKAGTGNFGLALRIQRDGADRGCFAIYQGLSDIRSSAAYCARLAARDPRYPAVEAREASSLDLEVSIFGPWELMKGPEDFLPGLDSVLLKSGDETTLLQAPVAAERGYDRAEFLSRLSNKAGLGLDGWQRPGLAFFRAKTVWSRRPFYCQK
jgi:AMMECR1 domain-containing protein